MEKEASPSTHACRGSGHGRIVLGLALGLSLATGLAWAGLRSHAGSGQHGSLMARHSPQLVHDFVEFKVDRELRAVNASDEQMRQVRSILDRAFAEHAARLSQHEEVHQQALGLLSAETIDTVRLEALRAEQVQRLDEASRKLVATTVEIAQVLTPQQRQKLSERHQQRIE